MPRDLRLRRSGPRTSICSKVWDIRASQKVEGVLRDLGTSGAGEGRSPPSGSGVSLFSAFTPPLVCPCSILTCPQCTQDSWSGSCLNGPFFWGGGRVNNFFLSRLCSPNVPRSPRVPEQEYCDHHCPLVNLASGLPRPDHSCLVSGQGWCCPAPPRPPAVASVVSCRCLMKLFAPKVRRRDLQSLSLVAIKGLVSQRLPLAPSRQYVELRAGSQKTSKSEVLSQPPQPPGRKVNCVQAQSTGSLCFEISG